MIGKQFPPPDWKAYAEKVGVLEGAANILAALYLKSPWIGRQAFFDVAVTVDSNQTYPLDHSSRKDFYTHAGAALRDLHNRIQAPHLNDQPDV